MTLKRRSKAVKKQINGKTEKKTTAYIYDFDGKDCFAIAEEDEDGVEGKGIISFGITKARAILKHKDELQEFVDGYGKAKN